MANSVTCLNVEWRALCAMHIFDEDSVMLLSQVLHLVIATLGDAGVPATENKPQPDTWAIC